MIEWPEWEPPKRQALWTMAIKAAILAMFGYALGAALLKVVQ